MLFSGVLLTLVMLSAGHPDDGGAMRKKGRFHRSTCIVYKLGGCTGTLYQSRTGLYIACT
jgi:hypothetical protein